MEITKREILFSVIIILIMIGLGIPITYAISDNVQESNEKYYSMSVIEDQDLFNHCCETNRGDIFSIANISTKDPVSLKEINGEYAYIYYEYEEEHYKSRQVEVTETKTDSKGNTYTETHYETEWYWEWDVEDTAEYKSSTLILNGIEVDSKNVSGFFGNTKYIEEENLTNKEDYYYSSGYHHYLSSHKRVSYEVVPTDQSGSCICTTKDNSVSNIKFYRDKDPNELKESCIESPVPRIVIFWVGWIILTAIIVYGFYYFDNKWLESKNNQD